MFLVLIPAFLLSGVLCSVVLGLHRKENSAGDKTLNALPEALELLDLGTLAW